MSSNSVQNPFDAPEQPFLVLTNELKQLSLWPENIQLPLGWQTIYGPDSRNSCVDFVQERVLEE